MNLSRTAAMLIAVLVVLICVSAYLWFFLGITKPEVDPRVGSLRQSFTCEHCGHAFTMTIEDMGRMRRTRGQVYCPKCSAGGARKDIGPAPAGAGDVPASQPAAGREPLPTASPLADRLDGDAAPRSSPEREDQAAVLTEGRASQ